LRPDSCPINWRACTPVAASALLAELIGYLARPEIGDVPRAHAEAVLNDLLEPTAMTTIDVRMPVDARAREVAEALADDPADGRTLAEWGRDVGASGRTLARAFLTETGLPFGRWRASVRIRASIVARAGGESIGMTARLVGYESASAFVAAFRPETGRTPARFFGTQRSMPIASTRSLVP
jgi:AraC-like DNA-binding protein